MKLKHILFFLQSIFLTNASAQNTVYKPENSKEINFATYQELRKLNLEIKIKSVFNDGTILNKPKYDSLVANAEILKFQSANGTLLPYLYDEKTGYMVFTNVTIDNLTHEMWLPVMDGANKAMKGEEYTYSTRYNGEKTVEPASMFDVNKTIMRCLVKNLAMFGLGLYIYSGEDLPEEPPLPDLSDKELIEKYLSQNPQNKTSVDEYLKTKSEHEVAEMMKNYIDWSK